MFLLVGCFHCITCSLFTYFLVILRFTLALGRHLAVRNNMDENLSVALGTMASQAVSTSFAPGTVKNFVKELGESMTLQTFQKRLQALRRALCNLRPWRTAEAHTAAMMREQARFRVATEEISPNHRHNNVHAPGAVAPNRRSKKEALGCSKISEDHPETKVCSSRSTLTRACEPTGA